MWPWEHAAVAYISYSLLSRLAGLRPLSAVTAIAVMVGSQVPDLVDKPLAWWLHVLPAGRSLGHSLVFALPVLATVYWVSRAGRRAHVGLAFGVGYLSHLPGDVFYSVLLGGSPEYEFLLYPLVPRAGNPPADALLKVTSLLTDFLGFLSTPRGLVYLGGEVVLLGTALLLWVQDGTPGLVRFRRRVRQAFA